VLPLIGPQEKAMRSSARKARPLLNAPLQFRATDLVEFDTLVVRLPAVLFQEDSRLT